MARRPEPLRNFVSEGVGDQVIKDKQGILYGTTISWKGATVGDRIVLTDAATVAAAQQPGAFKVWEFILSTAAGHFSPNFGEVGKRFENGLVMNLQSSISAADDFVLSADYD